MSKHFRQNALSYGEEGKKWLDSIPLLIQEYEHKWNIKVSEPFPLSYNYVAPAIREDESHSVLKIGYPTDREFQTEIQALKIFQGDGIAKLLEIDEDNSVILIEHVLPGQPLSQISNDDEATRICARVMKKFWKPLPPNHNFITIHEWTSAFSELRSKYNGTTGPLPSRLVDSAQELFNHLIQTSTHALLLHGDLHHDNILTSSRAKWLAIDPKGIAAEPAYEVAAMIRNPYEKLKDISNLRPLLERRLDILSEELGFDKTRLLQWCLSQTVLSAVWNVDNSKGPEHAIRVAEVLSTMITN